jgi:hypothetical protein
MDASDLKVIGLFKITLKSLVVGEAVDTDDVVELIEALRKRYRVVAELTGRQARLEGIEDLVTMWVVRIRLTIGDVVTAVLVRRTGEDHCGSLSS